MDCRSTAAADAAHVCFIVRSSSISCEDRLFSLVRIGYSTDSSLDSRSVFRFGNGAGRRSAKRADLRLRQRNGQVVERLRLYARFYGFETFVASESARWLEPEGTIMRSSAD